MKMRFVRKKCGKFMSWKCVVYHFLWRCFAVVNHKKMWKITSRPQIGWIMLLAPPFSAWNAEICRMTYSPSYLLDCLCLYNWIPEWKRAEWRERENRICCRSPEWFMAKNFAPWDNQINSLCHFHCVAWIFHAAIECHCTTLKISHLYNSREAAPISYIHDIVIWLLFFCLSQFDYVL